MAKNAIQKISREAKRIRKIHPSMTWKACIKKASLNYRTGKIGSLPAVLQTSLRPGKKIGKTKRRATRKKRKIGIRENFVVVKKNGATVGAKSYHKRQQAQLQKQGLSVSSAKGFIKTNLKEQLGRALLKREMAQTASVHNQASRVISHLRSEIKKFC